MTIRFLQTVASENPAYPFQAGQIITVAAPSAYLLSLLDGVRAEVVKADLERAVDVAPEQPEVRRRQRRSRERS